MTPSTDELSRMLRGAADDIVDRTPVPGPDTPRLWGRGRRATWLARGAAGGLVAVLVAATTFVVWPSGVPRASVPAVRLDDGALRLTSYPDVIAKPPSIRETTTPGVTAALIPGYDTLAPAVAVSPVGAVTHVPLPRDESGMEVDPALSPDGRWLARGPVLTDLVSGASVPSRPDQLRLGSAWAPSQQPSWWSPDSRRVFVATFNQGTPRFGGLLVGTDGTTTEVPLVEEALVPITAGWLDADTLLALVDLGPGTTRLSVRTWTVGDPGWTDTGTVISWLPTDSLETRASISPDGSRLLLLSSADDPAASSVTGTEAMLFDPRTGAQLGWPDDAGVVDPSRYDAGSAVGWDGWGCRPAWRQGLPVATDGTVHGFVDTDPNGVVDGKATYDLVSVSSGYGQPCISFAGDELRGVPVTNHLALWQERLWNWGVPLLGLALLLAGLWAWSRRHTSSWRERPSWLPTIFAQPF